MPSTRSPNFAFLAHHNEACVADPQRKRLDRIASQVKHDIVDSELLENGDLEAEGGGFTRLNKALEGQLDALFKE